jgi:hypothetical protein
MLAIAFMVIVACALCATTESSFLRLRENQQEANWMHRLLSIKADWFTGETVSTYDGDVPRTTCPVGKYRVSSGSNLYSNKGLRVDGCIPCPRGRYGDAEGLTTAACSGSCPKGRYSDRIGITTVEDCMACESGKYGSSLGLTTAACTASCNSGYYTENEAAEASIECVACPTGYSQSPCDQGMTEREPRNGS